MKILDRTEIITLENITFGGLVIDTLARKARVKNQTFHFTKAEMKVFCILLLARGEVCKYERLYFALYGVEAHDDAADITGPIICRLRSKLPPGWIGTKKNEGYFLSLVRLPRGE